MSLEPIEMKSLTVAKTDFLFSKDNSVENHGIRRPTITGYKERLERTNSRAEKILTIIQNKEKCIPLLLCKQPHCVNVVQVLY